MEDDLTIPAFLLRKGNRLNNDQIAALLSTNRSWAPIKSIAECRLSTSKPTTYPDDSTAEVHVIIKEPDYVHNLAIYANFSEFMNEHNFFDYPYRQMGTAGGVTVVRVGMAVWVSRAINIPAGQPVVVHRISTKDRVWQYADQQWEASGKPMDKKVVLELRKVWMVELEKEGIKKVTSSSEFGQWMKKKFS